MNRTRLNRTRLIGWGLVGIQGTLLALLVLGPFDHTWGVPHGLRIAGTVLRWAGGAAIIIGALRLGTAASVHPEPTAKAVLRVNGPYRFVRHPIYSGVILLGGGIAATAGSVLAIVFFLGLVVLFSIKARFEERLLAERFTGYRAYAATTPRFVPGFGFLNKT